MRAIRVTGMCVNSYKTDRTSVLALNPGSPQSSVSLRSFFTLCLGMFWVCGVSKSALAQSDAATGKVAIDIRLSIGEVMLLSPYEPERSPSGPNDIIFPLCPAVSLFNSCPDRCSIHVIGNEKTGKGIVLIPRDEGLEGPTELVVSTDRKVIVYSIRVTREKESTPPNNGTQAPIRNVSLPEYGSSVTFEYAQGHLDWWCSDACACFVKRCGTAPEGNSDGTVRGLFLARRNTQVGANVAVALPKAMAFENDASSGQKSKSTSPLILYKIRPVLAKTP